MRRELLAARGSPRVCVCGTRGSDTFREHPKWQPEMGAALRKTSATHRVLESDVPFERLQVNRAGAEPQLHGFGAPIVELQIVRLIDADAAVELLRQEGDASAQGLAPAMTLHPFLDAVGVGHAGLRAPRVQQHNDH